MSLTPQEERFCLEYIGNGRKGTMAAISAGYPANDAEQIAKDLLKRADIKAELRLYSKPIVIDPPSYWAARARFDE